MEVRLLFDEYEPKVTKHFDFANGAVAIDVVCAEQTQPGALQSGIFLWPAASALSHYLCDELDLDWNHVVELGAGCGLSGLVAARLLQQRNRNGSVIFTDRDWTSLRMIRKSVVDSGGFGSAVAIKRKALLWTEQPPAPDVKFSKFDEATDLVIGSDLVYSTESGRALLFTVSRMMPTSNTWRFLLSSSFRDPETTRILDAACAECGLQRKLLREGYHGCWIEEYHRRQET